MTRRSPAEFANLRRATWEHRLRGVHPLEIASGLNVPVGTVYRWLKELSQEAAAQAQEMASSHLQLELDRLDHLWAVMELELERLQETNKPVARTVEVLSKLSERRAKLLGLDKPTQVEATVHEVTQVDLALEELVREAEAAAAVEEAAVKESQS